MHNEYPKVQPNGFHEHPLEELVQAIQECILNSPRF